MTATGHTCARCGDAIAADEPYVAITIQWERTRPGWIRSWRVVSVRHADVVARVHEDCTEDLTEAVRSAVGTR